MGRYAADKQKPRIGIKAYWSAMQARAEAFTVSDIEGASQGDRRNVSDYIRRLTKAGFLAVVEERPVAHNGSPEKVYRIVRPSFHPPRVRRDGTILPPSANDHMWRTMKMLGNFRPDELADAATTDEVTVSLETAKTYCVLLKAAGYLAEVKKACPSGRLTTYRFLASKNTGPLPPEIQRIKEVYDPNLRKVMYREEPDNG